MTNDRRIKAAQRLHALGINHVSQDESVIPTPCPFEGEQFEDENGSVRVDLSALTYRCKSCDKSGPLEELLQALEDDETPTIQAEVVDAEISENAIIATQSVPTINAEIVELELPLNLTSAQVISENSPENARHSRGRAEKSIITLLALVFLIAGLAAAGLSGFANYRAFSQSVTDPFQAKIWGWTGVIASIVAFGGFTFFYWHTANRRVKEGLRALVFAIAGVVTSIVGTHMYIENNNAQAAGQLDQAQSNRAVIEAQIADWRSQLEGIPASTRSVEGLESYILEVERVGRSHQKPYRDAQNELGLAKRRDELQSKIEAANADLLGLGKSNVAVSADHRPSLPSWFFAIMLEVFSSQGTSIALVALLILYGRRPVS